VVEAQTLRWNVFAEEMGARLPSRLPGLDIDEFDPWCEHLIARDDDTGEVIGTYRVLTPERARLFGRLYSDHEFNLGPLAPLRATMVELGRSCVHPGFRHGGVVLAMWGALGRFMVARGFQTMVGCASMPMRDGGHAAASLWRELAAKHLAEPRWLVQPRLALPVGQLNQTLQSEAPPLIKGYLRLGAKVLGAPAWDPDFNTADFPLLMRLQDLPARHCRHLLGGVAQGAVAA
jgi:putative hemolysin